MKQQKSQSYLRDCTITVDAAGTQTKIMDKIKKKGGHFCLQLKKNQKTAFGDVDLFFKDMEKMKGKNGKASVLLQKQGKTMEE